MLPALATTEDAEVFGLTVTDAALVQASTRVRSYVGQQITPGESTVTARGPMVRLPERPVTAVTAVADDEGVEVDEAETPREVGWWLEGSDLYLPTSRTYTVTYEHGHDVIPDGLVEIVCTIAARLSGALVSAGQTLGFDAWRGQFGLTAEEKSVLGRLFPRSPRTMVMRG